MFIFFIQLHRSYLKEKRLFILTKETLYCVPDFVQKGRIIGWDEIINIEMRVIGTKGKTHNLIVYYKDKNQECIKLREKNVILI